MRDNDDPSPLQRYITNDLRPDAVAGLTVAVMGVPQAMAYALIAGLPPIYFDAHMGLVDLDKEFVAERRRLVTRGYARLLEINQWPGDRDITEYPLPDVIEKYKSRNQ